VNENETAANKSENKNWSYVHFYGGASDAFFP
jgi:hypothetical protein